MAYGGAVVGVAAVGAVAAAALTLLRWALHCSMVTRQTAREGTHEFALMGMVCCMCSSWFVVGLVAAGALAAAVLTCVAQLLVLRCGAAPWRMLDSARGAGLTRPCSWVSLQSTLRNSRSAIG